MNVRSTSALSGRRSFHGSSPRTPAASARLSCCRKRVWQQWEWLGLIYGLCVYESLGKIAGWGSSARRPTAQSVLAGPPVGFGAANEREFRLVQDSEYLRMRCPVAVPRERLRHANARSANGSGPRSRLPADRPRRIAEIRGGNEGQKLALHAPRLRPYSPAFINRKSTSKVGSIT